MNKHHLRWYLLCRRSIWRWQFPVPMNGRSRLSRLRQLSTLRRSGDFQWPAGAPAVSGIDLRVKNELVLSGVISFRTVSLSTQFRVKPIWNINGCSYCDTRYGYYGVAAHYLAWHFYPEVILGGWRDVEIQEPTHQLPIYNGRQWHATTSEPDVGHFARH